MRPRRFGKGTPGELRASLVVVLAASAIAGHAQSTAEWPQLFGATRNARALGAIAPTATLSVGWKRSMPSGGAGIAVAGDRIYTLGTDGETDLLFALEASSGNEAWRLVLGDTHADATANGPNSTPAIAGDLLLTVSTACQLRAVNLKTREIAWTQDIGSMFASRFVKRGGCGMSPLVAGSRLVLTTGAPEGARLAAFDLATGAPAWTTADLPNSYNVAPGWNDGLVLYHHIKSPGGSGISAVNAETGAIAWQIDGPGGESDATPVIVPEGRVLIENWPHVSLFDVRTRKPLWTSREIVAGRSPAVAHKEHIYTFGGQSGEFLTCVESATGKTKWTSRIYRGHLVLAGDTLVILSEAAGLVRLVAADPSGYRELAQIAVLTPGARTGTPPSVASGRIFVRNLDELAAVVVR